MNEKLGTWGYVTVQVAEDLTTEQSYDTSVMRQQVENIVKDQNRGRYCRIRRVWGNDRYNVHGSPQMPEEKFKSLLTDVEGSELLDEQFVSD